jgi:tRNA G10  N-methylase Trm11
LGLIRNIDRLDLDIDEEMWYSITPEAVAKSHARTVSRVVSHGLFLDAFCGYGTDMIYHNKYITTIGCDVVIERLVSAKRLHASLGKSHSDYVLTDSVNGKSCFRQEKIFDAVYLSPPWGHQGIRSRDKDSFFGNRKLHQLIVDGTEVFKRAIPMARDDNIAFYLPRGIAESDIIRLSMMTRNCMNVFAHIHCSYDPDDETGSNEELKARAITVYFGRLAKKFLEKSSLTC